MAWLNVRFWPKADIGPGLRSPERCARAKRLQCPIFQLRSHPAIVKIQMRLRMCVAAVALTAIVLAAWLFIPRPAPSPTPPKLATVPVLEKLRWGMTVSEVRGLYPQIDILAITPGGT
jgi:hypothetical protein